MYDAPCDAGLLRLSHECENVMPPRALDLNHVGIAVVLLDTEHRPIEIKRAFGIPNGKRHMRQPMRPYHDPPRWAYSSTSLRRSVSSRSHRRAILSTCGSTAGNLGA